MGTNSLVILFPFPGDIVSCGVVAWWIVLCCLHVVVSIFSSDCRDLCLSWGDRWVGIWLYVGCIGWLFVGCIGLKRIHYLAVVFEFVRCVRFECCTYLLGSMWAPQPSALAVRLFRLSPMCGVLVWGAMVRIAACASSRRRRHLGQRCTATSPCCALCVAFRPLPVVVSRTMTLVSCVSTALERICSGRMLHMPGLHGTP